MDEGLLPAAVRDAAADRRGGATEVAARALHGLLEVAGDPRRLEAAVAALLAGQPAMAPVWHLARAARGPDPRAALAGLRARLHADADAAVDAAAAWLRPRLAGGGRAAVATVSHSSLVDRALARLDPGPGGAARPVVGLVGADAVGPEAFLNAAGTGELAARLPTLVVATAIKLLPAEAFARLAGPGFEAVPLRAVAAVVVGPEVLSPAEAGRMAANVTGTRPDPEEAAMTEDPGPALSVALAYYHAWTGKDVDRAMTHVADDVVCDSPLGRIEGVQGLRAFMAPFAGMLKRSDLIAAFGDDQTAVLIYNPHTTLVEDAPSGECFTVRDGRIVHILLVFDRTPFDEARRRSN